MLTLHMCCIRSCLQGALTHLFDDRFSDTKATELYSLDNGTILDVERSVLFDDSDPRRSTVHRCDMGNDAPKLGELWEWQISGCNCF